MLIFVSLILSANSIEFLTTYSERPVSGLTILVRCFANLYVGLLMIETIGLIGMHICLLCGFLVIRIAEEQQ